MPPVGSPRYGSRALTPPVGKAGASVRLLCETQHLPWEPTQIQMHAQRVSMVITHTRLRKRKDLFRFVLGFLVLKHKTQPNSLNIACSALATGRWGGWGLPPTTVPSTWPGPVATSTAEPGSGCHHTYSARGHTRDRPWFSHSFESAVNLSPAPGMGKK